MVGSNEVYCPLINILFYTFRVIINDYDINFKSPYILPNFENVSEA